MTALITPGFRRPSDPRPRAGACVAAALLVGSCLGGGKTTTFENSNIAVPAGHFKTVGTLATSAATMDIRMMVQVRLQLQKAGLNAVKVSGRYATLADAVAELCASGADQPIDGLLAVAYNELTLFDCETRKPAYAIHSGSLGLPQLTDRLVHYLKGRPESSPDHP